MIARIVIETETSGASRTMFRVLLHPVTADKEDINPVGAATQRAQCRSRVPHRPAGRAPNVFKYPYEAERAALRQRSVYKPSELRLLQSRRRANSISLGQSPLVRQTN